MVRSELEITHSGVEILIDTSTLRVSSQCFCFRVQQQGMLTTVQHSLIHESIEVVLYVDTKTVNLLLCVQIFYSRHASFIVLWLQHVFNLWLSGYVTVNKL